jgi:hypothetical protein
MLAEHDAGAMRLDMRSLRGGARSGGVRSRRTDPPVMRGTLGLMPGEESGPMAAGFGRLAGAWRGTNGFRLMPTDDLYETPATAALTTAANEHVLVVTYAWTHPDDGPQDGMLVVGSPDDERQLVTAAWGDSWHQKPNLRMLTGTLGERRLEVTAEYGGGWAWMISLDGHRGDRLALTMYNVIPVEHATDEAPAGPYSVMVGELRSG